jgi:hypothetical protein
MVCHRWLVLLVVLSAVDAGERAGEQLWPMRWRVYSDAEAGITVRYPYTYSAPNQYKGELLRNRNGGFAVAQGEEREIEVDGKKVRVIVSATDRPRATADMRIFSVTEAELPPEAVGKNLAAIGSVLAKSNIPWVDYDYYSKHVDRPFADKKWAPKELVAMRGESDQACGIVIKHGSRYSGVVLTGNFSKEDNAAILNSFEILLPGKNKAPSMSWREGQLRSGKVMDEKGTPIATSTRVKATSWKEGWDVETAHYHITSHVSPARLAQYAQYLEVVYSGFSEIYQPQSMPPYKMEIHIFNTHEDFMRAAVAHGFPVGESVGGFFVPDWMSIFAYEDSNKWGGDDFSVEHVLAHECSHQFLNVACNGSRHVPTWINEGLAVYFEAGIAQGGHFVARTPKKRIDNLKSIYAAKKTTIIPIDDYLTHYDHIAPAQYGEVYAMTNFWLFGTCKDDCKHKPNECGLAHFRDYWKRLQAKEDGTKAFEATFMSGLIKAKGSREAAIAAWEQAYFEYVKRVLR